MLTKWLNCYCPRWNAFQRCSQFVMSFFLWSRIWSWWEWREKPVGTDTDGTPAGGLWLRPRFCWIPVGTRGSSSCCFKTKISNPPPKHSSYHIIYRFCSEMSLEPVSSFTAVQACKFGFQSPIGRTHSWRFSFKNAHEVTGDTQAFRHILV